MRSGVRNRPSGGPGGDVWVLSTLPGTLEKGGPSFTLLQYKGTQVMMRPHLIPSITPLPQYGIRPNLISTESCDQGESNGAGCKEFGRELTEDVGFYQRINHLALIRIINTFYFRLCLHWPSFLFFKGFLSILDRFQWDLEYF